MKAFKISSPAYRANGLNGVYYSIALTDDNGNIIKGIGDHIGFINNVYESEGKHFSDEGRIISVEEVSFQEEDFDAFFEGRNEYYNTQDTIDKERIKLFGEDHYKYIYGNKEGVEERQKKYVDFEKKSNKALGKFPHYYDFLKIIK